MCPPSGWVAVLENGALAPPWRGQVDQPAMWPLARGRVFAMKVSFEKTSENALWKYPPC